MARRGLLALCILAQRGCGETGGDQKYAAKLASCGLTDGGDVSPSFERNGSSCLRSCIVALTCEELVGLECEASVPDAALDCALAVPCLEPFFCDDGETELMKLSICDGIADCEDGADEQDCPTFRCDDGERIPVQDKCDGFPTCADGSDENGCAVLSCPS